MLKKIIFTLLALNVFVFAEFQSINAVQMLKIQKDGGAIIDIRTPAEWEETGVIEGTTKIMFFDETGGYNIEKFMSEFKKVVKDQNQSFVLICRSANRTKTLGHYLAQNLGYINTKDLDGGISKWISEGKKVVKGISNNR